MNYIIAIDQSTSSTKALLFDEECRMLARTNVDHKQYYPQTGWVEHDAEEIYVNMIEAIRRGMIISMMTSPTMKVGVRIAGTLNSPTWAKIAV